MKAFSLRNLAFLVSMLSSFTASNAFQIPTMGARTHHRLQMSASSREIARRSFLGGIFFVSSGLGFNDQAWAKERPPLDSVLYNILRVREATAQETRLIKSGKFKDVQRANIKLAVKFMVQNYRLADSFVAASAYLDGNERRIQAGAIGQSAVQNLQTILEYFDTSDVQNLKVEDTVGEKQDLVLKGLDATRREIDEFLTYFPADQVDKVKARVSEENDLNLKEFDSSLGNILNMPAKT